MTIPTWALLGFAAWTVLLLLSTVGVYRWSRILGGRAPITAFRAETSEADGWYHRAMRAHANCLENLPVFGAIVFALYVSDVGGIWVDSLSIAVLAARVLQSLIHVGLPQTGAVVSLRFAFFLTQLICFVLMIMMVVRTAALPV